VVKEVRVSDRKPSERAGIVGAVFAGEGLDSGIGLGVAILQELAGHGLQQS
jgi:hypothetical protein